MSKSSSMSASLLYLCFVTNILCVRFTNGVSTKINKPFWINPCGDTFRNEGFDDNDIIDRILTLANYSKINIDLFKSSYISKTFNCDYFKHYQRWVELNNSWMTPLLLKSAEEDMPEWWLFNRSFPEELKFTYEVLQRVAVGFEMLIEDAKKYNSSESYFLSQFITCKKNLQQLLCETSDSIDITLQKRPVDVGRGIIPKEVQQESTSTKRNLTNSIIFRDYMIAIKYILNTYGNFKKRFELFHHTTNISDVSPWYIM